MSDQKHTPLLSAADQLAVIEEHRQPVDFESAKKLLDQPRTSAARAIAAARSAAVDAVLDSEDERITRIDSIALGMVARLAADAAMTSMLLDWDIAALLALLDGDVIA